MSKRALAMVGTVLFAGTPVFAAQQYHQNAVSESAVKPATVDSAQQKAVDDLRRASEKLRDALSVLERESAAGPNHDQALKAAKDALRDTRDTMSRLQAQARVAPWKATAATGSTGVRPTAPEALKRLRAASDTLYDAVHAMARLPAGQDRNEAIRKADQALFDTEQAAVLSELDYKLPNARSS